MRSLEIFVFISNERGCVLCTTIFHDEFFCSCVVRTENTDRATDKRAHESFSFVDLFLICGRLVELKLKGIFVVEENRLGVRLKETRLWGVLC